MNTDLDLLREYVERHSEAAFATLAQRHLNLVFSVALRKTSNAHAAEEITQAVFIILARKARSLRPGTILSGWLYQTARLTAANYLRTEIRRARREQEAYMESRSNEPEPNPWPEIAPLLEDAMGQLREKDRNAIVLCYLEGKSLDEVGSALGISADAAKMRVSRAVEKLRVLFNRRGVVASASVIVSAVAANSMQAAPVGLATATFNATATGATTQASTLSLASSTLKTMLWLRLKTAVVIGAILLVAGSAMVARFGVRDSTGFHWRTSGVLGDSPLIVPKVSVGKIHAGMTIPEIITTLGEPDKRIGGFLHYVRSGFSVISDPRGELLRSIFCGDAMGRNGPMTKAFKGRTETGIGMGSSRAEIIRAYGPPSSVSPTASNESLRYETLGMNFTLVQDKVVFIVVDF